MSGKRKPIDSANSRSAIQVRPAPGDRVFELHFPTAMLDRADDLAEVRDMIDAGELEIAADELRWLLEDCRDLLEAHRLLGEIALEQADMKLGRAHFGYAYQLGLAAMPKDGLKGSLPYARPTNQPLLESAKGLAHCLIQLGKRETAAEVLRQLLDWDPQDPLNAQAMLKT